MKVNLYAIIILLIASNKSFAQDSIFVKRISTIDGSPINSLIIKEECKDLTSSDDLKSYLKSIKDITSPATLNYYIANIKKSKTACALNIPINDGIQRVIAINEEYYSSKGSQQYQKAMFIWIIGHEFTHHLRADYYYGKEKDELVNLSSELLCDENAGYFVGKLTKDVNLSSLQSILASVLRNNENSIYHPAVKYRILAAQAGWLRAKSETIPVNQKVCVLNDTILKTINERTGKRCIYQIKGTNKYGVARIEYDNDRLFMGSIIKGIGLEGEGATWTFKSDNIQSIYIGAYKNDLENGFGTLIWKMVSQGGNGVAANSTMANLNCEYQGEKYHGFFLNGKKSGYGTYYWPNGEIFIGEYNKNYRNGHGILYNTRMIIQEGYWNDDKYMGSNCEQNENTTY